MQQISDGLQALHNAGSFHRNLNAENVLLYGTDDQLTIELNNYSGFPGVQADHQMSSVPQDTILI